MNATDETPVTLQDVAPAYHAALLALGATHTERAARMGVSVRSMIAYLRGDTFPQAHVLKRVPELDQAFTQDLDGILQLIRGREENQRPSKSAA